MKAYVTISEIHEFDLTHYHGHRRLADFLKRHPTGAVSYGMKPEEKRELAAGEWNGEKVSRLRKHAGLTLARLGEELSGPNHNRTRSALSVYANGLTTRKRIVRPEIINALNRAAEKYGFQS